MLNNPPNHGGPKDAGYPWPPPRDTPPRDKDEDKDKDKDKDKSDEDIRKELEKQAAALQMAYNSQYAAATQQAGAVIVVPIVWNASQVLYALIAAYGLSEAAKMIITGRLEDSFSGAI